MPLFFSHFHTHTSIRSEGQKLIASLTQYGFGRSEQWHIAVDDLQVIEAVRFYTTALHKVWHRLKVIALQFRSIQHQIRQFQFEFQVKTENVDGDDSATQFSRWSIVDSLHLLSEAIFAGAKILGLYVPCNLLFGLRTKT